MEHNEDVMLQPTDGSERILKGHDEKVMLKPSDERKKIMKMNDERAVGIEGS